MKFTLSWLKDHLDTEASLDEIVECLTMIGLEVEEVIDRAAKLKPFTIAKVLTCEDHPDSDHLHVLKVDIGSGEPLQIVCGAPNAHAGMIGVLGQPGDYVPGIDVTLSISKIRGVESFGMMCSERELELSDAHTGIIELPADAPVGSSYAEYIGLHDPVIDVSLTPNRPDCTGVFGVARDLAAAGLGKLKDRKAVQVRGTFPCPTKALFEFGDTPSLCKAYGLRLVKGVKNGPSPKWMQERLIAIGLRPINTLVDITNYMTFDQGRPLHVFDLKNLDGDIIVRRANKGESLLTLNGKTYELDEEMCVIADRKGIESIAGIIGGEGSGCEADTTDVLIESALWDENNIARTGRRLGVTTDARYRFERGVDPDYMLPGLELATKMVIDLCGGEPSEVAVTGEVPEVNHVIDFPIAEVKRLTGLEIAKAEAIGILKLLGFWVTGTGDVVKVAVPSWRPDVEGKADLVEEVVRIAGLDKVTSTPLPRLDRVAHRVLTTSQIRRSRMRRTLASRGMNESVTWSFISKQQAEIFGGGQPELALANPISGELSDMRPSLLPGLISAAQRNADRGYPDVALFEIGQVFHSDKAEDQGVVATGVRRGTAGFNGAGRHWSGNAEAVNVFDAKADAIAALAAIGAPVEKLQVYTDAPSWFHPGRSGALKLGPKMTLAYFGEIHPRTLHDLDVEGPLVGFEILIDNVPEPKSKGGRSKGAMTVGDLMPVRRDFAFVVAHDVTAETLLKAVRGAEKTLITDVNLFDVYEGEGVGEGKKSLAIDVTLQPKGKTLTDEDLESVTKKIVAAVEKATGGTLRA